MNINLIILLKIYLYNIGKQIFIYLIKLLQHCYISPIEIFMYSVCNTYVTDLTLPKTSPLNNFIYENRQHKKRGQLTVLVPYKSAISIKVSIPMVLNNYLSIISMKFIKIIFTSEHTTYIESERNGIICRKVRGGGICDIIPHTFTFLTIG